MDRQSLIKSISFQMTDPYSADTITKAITTIQGLKKEELYLKETGSPSPKADPRIDIPVTLLRHESKFARTALIVSHEKGAEILDLLPWLSTLVDMGMVLVAVELSSQSPPGNIVARIVRVVSYADLRRDVVDRGRIFLFGAGELAVWALAAAVLEDRISGVILVDTPLLQDIPSGGSLAVPEVSRLLAPRKLAVVGIPNPEREFAETVKAYRRIGASSSLRFEEENRGEALRKVVLWMIQEEVKA